MNIKKEKFAKAAGYLAFAASQIDKADTLLLSCASGSLCEVEGEITAEDKRALLQAFSDLDSQLVSIRFSMGRIKEVNDGE